LDDAAAAPTERSIALPPAGQLRIFDLSPRTLVMIAGLAIIYFAAGKLGLYYASFNASSSAIWPPSGIAFAALLLFGTQTWPAVFIGAFFVNLTTAGTVFTSILIATGNTIEAVAAVYLTTRYANGRKLFERSQDFFKFVAIGMFASALSASIGLASLALGGLAPMRDFAWIWMTWWMGDLGGFVLVAPVPILWIMKLRLTGGRRGLIEGILTLVAIAVFGLLVFGGALPGAVNYPISFICIPMLVWTAFRHGQRVSATAMLLLAVSTAWGIGRGLGPWARFADPIASFIIPQAFMMTMAVMTLALAGVVRERKHAIADANEARNLAEASNRAKDHFLAMLGHELRNPIGALSSAVHVLERGDVRPEQSARLLEIMARQSRHLARIVDDLLDVGRLTAGRITLNRHPMNLGECARECFAALSVREEYAGRNVDLRIENTRIDGDPERIAQILTNLLSNAFKHTRPGGKINLSVRSEGNRAVILVRDDGAGISADLLPHVFDLFVQGERRSDRRLGGLGIGLTLVKRLVELHGGTVEAHSDGPGRGSTFTVLIPRIETSAETATKQDAPARAETGRRILIVEDNADAREALREALEKAGHEIFEASSGTGGVESALANRPDVALIDIGLPEFDGYEVARRIRSATPIRGMMLVALTGYGLPEDRRRAEQAGFDAHLVKPLDFARLADLLTARTAGTALA
jgi:signal transduction histidine kinase/ActR/RegA family two-component response regulator